ncbi:hypothetical protein cyc_05887 [Cyclospora cayetanensis]|uniref:Uncharacterized protein n=1 Tax=Cyclospora cayetanensis TaxID=88456 RepID=A0A1D3DAM9_9EIME|nr:hypothetical protein cyc_05887 [Cyclospora cayetanensis]
MTEDFVYTPAPPRTHAMGTRKEGPGPSEALGNTGEATRNAFQGSTGRPKATDWRQTPQAEKTKAREAKEPTIPCLFDGKAARPPHDRLCKGAYRCQGVRLYWSSKLDGLGS